MFITINLHFQHSVLSDYSSESERSVLIQNKKLLIFFFLISKIPQNLHFSTQFQPKTPTTRVRESIPNPKKPPHPHNHRPQDADIQIV